MNSIEKISISDPPPLNYYVNPMKASFRKLILTLKVDLEPSSPFISINKKHNIMDYTLRHKRIYEEYTNILANYLHAFLLKKISI